MGNLSTNANFDDSERWTALHDASKYGQHQVVQQLLDRGADIEVKDSKGWTALHDASKYGHLDVVKLLLDRGADIQGKDNKGWTALHWASFYGRLDVVKLLLDRGVDIEKQDNDGWTALHGASCEGHLEVVKLLLDRGDDIHKQDNDGGSSGDTIYPAVEVLRGQKFFLKANMMKNVPLTDTTSNVPYAYIEYCTDKFTSKRLGREGFGEVYLAHDKEEECIRYAVKKVPDDKVDSSMRETEVLRRLNHPNIMRLYGTTSHNGYTYLLLPHNPHGTLSTFLSTEDGRKQLDALTRVNILCGIAQVMHFLHNGGVDDNEKHRYIFCHRDINTDNIWLNEALNPLLSVYGIAKISTGQNKDQHTDVSVTSTVLEEQRVESNLRFGTRTHMCPQYDISGVYTTKCDVYLFGIVMLELLTGMLQLEPKDLARMYDGRPAKLCKSFDVAAGSWDGAEPKLSNLAIDCVAYELDDRPSSLKVLNELTSIQREMVKIFHVPSFRGNNAEETDK